MAPNYEYGHKNNNTLLLKIVKKYGIKKTYVGPLKYFTAVLNK